MGTPMQADMAELLDIREAAGFLRVSETSLRRWTNAGQLPCLRIGGRHERRVPRTHPLGVLGGAGPAAPAPPPKHLFEVYTSDIRAPRGAAPIPSEGFAADARAPGPSP